MKLKTTLFVLASLLGGGVFAKAEEAPKKRPAHPERPIPAEVLKEFDQDGDGKLNDEERAAMRAVREKKKLERYDTDKDGKLSDEEKAAMRASREKEMLEKFDADKDGKISDEERKAAREAGFSGPGGRHKHGASPDGPPPAPPAPPIPPTK